MLPAPVKILLLVEDNPGDAGLFREMMYIEGTTLSELTHVQTMDEAEQRLARHSYDVVLLDLGLPDAEGVEAIRRARAIAPNVPLVVLTGLDDESMASEALKEGAQDYLVKGQIEPRELRRAIRYAIERKSILLQIAHSANHDFLTGLPNRMLLKDRADQAIARAARHGSRVAVLFLDLDGFKHTNDSLGHLVGDKLLQSTASSIMGCVRASDTVCRQGGDEFIVLLADVAKAEDAATSANRILEAVAIPRCIDGLELHVTASIGVSVYPDDGLNAETLIRNADTAMYQAKENGRQGYQFFKPTMNARAVERQSIEEGLRRSLERKELSLHYQPKLSLITGAIVGAEALLRWAHPTRGSVSPAQFIPVAEDCGLILPIGDWVLREACTQARTWLDAGLPPITVGINVSAMQFRTANFLGALFATLGDTGVDPKSVELELTESVLMKRAESAASILHALRERGVRVALDDFGTGYSSLSYLQKFPVDALKIDQSFVRQISASGGDNAIVTAVIAMARSLKLRVTAEGVENYDELAFLRSLHCDEAQGYFFSRPVPPDEFATLLAAPGTPAWHQSPSLQAAQ